MTLTTERIVLNEERNVTFTAMVQAVNGEFGSIQARPAVLILPGGAYTMCSDREAEMVAYPYLQAGYHAFVLRYSVAQHKTWPNPLDDYEQAMELIRGKEQEWHVLTDKIAVIGFSAGGHLAASAATVSKNRPNAAILGYAATGELLTQMMHSQDAPAVVPTYCVDSDTCPCFLFAARDDSAVPVSNTVDFEQALLKNGIMYESHIYAYGGHGYSTCDKSMVDGRQCSRVAHWVADSIEWLGDVFGQLTPAGMSSPACPGRINGNNDKTLSVSCTMEHLKKQGDDVAVLLQEIVAALQQVYPDAKDEASLIWYLAGGMKLQEMMEALKIEETAIRELDAVLRQIPNRQSGEA